MSEDKYRAALDAAAKQLSCRALSTKMLRGKLLAKGHDEEATDYALAWLTERSLLSDGQFAESVVHGKGLRRGAHPSGAFPARHFTRGRGRRDGAFLPCPAADAFLARKAAARRPFRPEGGRQGGRRPAAARLFVERHQKRSRGIRRISRHRRIIFTPSAHTFVRKG